MPPEVLQQAEVVSLVAERVACAMPLHVRPDMSKPRSLARCPDQIVDCLARHRLTALGDE